MKKPREDELRIATEAAQWQRALQNGGPEVHAEFADWIKASPRHLREFMFMEALEAASQNIDPQHRMDVDLDSARNDANVLSLPTVSGSPSPALLPPRAASDPRGRPLRLIAAAACVLGVLAAFVWWSMPGMFGGWERYSTSVGEQRTVELEDGSVLQLNAKSRVRVRFTAAAREVRLNDGEALFKVAHDASRPFRVHTSAAVIRAVGTQFNVYRSSDNTRVAVLEGKVEIRPAGTRAVPQEKSASALRGSSSDVQYLAAGEAAQIERSGEVTRDLVVDITEATAWRQRRLVFREETLANIATEFNRYNRSPRIIVEGDGARNRRYGGTFDADDPESLVQFATRGGDLVIERRPGQILIRDR